MAIQQGNTAAVYLVPSQFDCLYKVTIKFLFYTVYGSSVQKRGRDNIIVAKGKNKKN